VPQPGASSELEGVFCFTSSDCWAVGGDRAVGVVLNEALNWNGTTWSQKPTPNPAGTANTDANNLIWVHRNSAGNCWAVGNTQQPTGPMLNQALHWNGTKWSTG
jgi:hypothetical protein